MTRVTGRVRYREIANVAGDIYVIEMRPSGLTLRRLNGRRSYPVAFDSILKNVILDMETAAWAKRNARLDKIAGVRCAAKSKNQLVMPMI